MKSKEYLIVLKFLDDGVEFSMVSNNCEPWGNNKFC